MTVACMQTVALPNGPAVVSDSARPQWVVQKFGGEYALLRSAAALKIRRNQCWQVPREHSTGGQVSMNIPLVGTRSPVAQDRPTDGTSGRGMLCSEYWHQGRWHDE